MDPYLPFILVAFIALSIFLWVWAIYDISKSEFESKNTQFLMILVVLISPVLGAIIYFQLKPQLTSTQRKRVFNPFKSS